MLPNSSYKYQQRADLVDSPFIWSTFLHRGIFFPSSSARALFELVKNGNWKDPSTVLQPDCVASQIPPQAVSHSEIHVALGAAGSEPDTGHARV